MLTDIRTYTIEDTYVKTDVKTDRHVSPCEESKCEHDRLALHSPALQTRETEGVLAHANHT